jgi:hypothetical protein
VSFQGVFCNAFPVLKFDKGCENHISCLAQFVDSRSQSHAPKELECLQASERVLPEMTQDFEILTAHNVTSKFDFDSLKFSSAASANNSMVVVTLSCLMVISRLEFPFSSIPIKLNSIDLTLLKTISKDGANVVDIFISNWFESNTILTQKKRSCKCLSVNLRIF